MAIHDIETMNQVIAALKEINPDIFVYGEDGLPATHLCPSSNAH